MKTVKVTTCIINDAVFISDIIKRHDTGLGFESLEEGLVRDADKLYRFSKPGILVNINRDKFSLKTIKRRSRLFLKEKGFFYSETARKIAELELRNTLKNI